MLEEQLFDLSNEYYEAICTKEYAFEKMKHFGQYNIINLEMSKLALLYDIEHVTKLLLGASNRLKEINPYDYCFNALNVRLNQLNTEEDDYKLMLKYMNSSATNMESLILKNIFKVTADGKQAKKAQQESEATFNALHNHFMLFHGTSNANVLSILE
jgi:hypothetical protein